MITSIIQFAVDVSSDSFKTDLPHAGAGSGQFADILKIVFACLAVLSVLMIVSAGLRFVTAQGNAQEVAKARGTIAYAIVGLLVAISAEAIVALVLNRV